MLSLTHNKVHFYYEYCQQCGACLAACPHNALSASLRPDGLSELDNVYAKAIQKPGWELG
jgi:ferredoxin